MTPQLSVLIGVYGQPIALELQWESLRQLPQLVKKRMEIVILDDHGDPPASIPPDIQRDFHTQLLRADVEIPWNQGGMRNLGIRQAKAPVAIMLDVDMVPKPLIWGKITDLIFRKKLGKGVVWKFALVGLRGTGDAVNMTSPNTWIFHREDFLSIAPYDEDYCGAKGYSDVQLQHIVREKFELVKRPDLLVNYYLNWAAADATVYTLNRSIARNGGIHKAIWKLIQRRYNNSWLKWWEDQVEQGKKGKCVRFPWSRISMSSPSES